MSKRLSVALATLIAATTILLLAAIFLWIAGSAVVVDDTRGVESAFVVNSVGGEQRLTRLWSGYLYAIPQIEGTILVRCRDGSTQKGGYVTGLAHTKIRVVGDTPCERLL